MAIAEQVALHLPYLRRFARALCGSQAGGDAYVVAMLEALVASPSSLEPGMDMRPALYKLLLDLWNSVSVNHAAGDFDAAAAPEDRKLETITPKPRQAFLLVSMEDFSPQEAAAILSVPEAELSALIEEAGRQIAEQVATDILIIEDEPLIALDLESVVTSIGHSVLSVARTQREAIAAIGSRIPGLVLADIRLADGSSGMDAVNDLLTMFEAPVIFITAYPDRLLTGDRPEPAFLITKPFQHDTVKAVVSQALFFDRKAKRTAQARMQAPGADARQ